MEEIPRESFEETGSGLELLVSTWVETPAALCSAAWKPIVFTVPTVASLF